MSEFRTSEVRAVKNDNLDIVISVGDCRIHILKFSCECQTWSIPQHFHSSNSYEIHYIFYAAFKQYYHMTMKEYRSRLSEQAPAAQR